MPQGGLDGEGLALRAADDEDLLGAQRLQQFEHPFDARVIVQGQGPVRVVPATVLNFLPAHEHSAKYQSCKFRGKVWEWDFVFTISSIGKCNASKEINLGTNVFGK